MIADVRDLAKKKKRVQLIILVCWSLNHTNLLIIVIIITIMIIIMITMIIVIKMIIVIIMMFCNGFDCFAHRSCHCSIVQFQLKRRFVRALCHREVKSHLTIT